MLWTIWSLSQFISWDLSVNLKLTQIRQRQTWTWMKPISDCSQCSCSQTFCHQSKRSWNCQTMSKLFRIAMFTPISKVPSRSLPQCAASRSTPTSFCKIASRSSCRLSSLRWRSVSRRRSCWLKTRLSSLTSLSTSAKILNPKAYKPAAHSWCCQLTNQ